jgi:hypothetical protein
MKRFDTTEPVKKMSCGRCTDVNGDRENHSDSCIEKTRLERKAKRRGLRPKDVSPGVDTPGYLILQNDYLEQWTLGIYSMPRLDEYLQAMNEMSIHR